MDTFTEANVETAMCLWEAALDMRDKLPELDRQWEAEGTVAIRHKLIAMVPACEAEWEADRAKGTERIPYDWEHCPAFLAAQFQGDAS